MQSNDYMQEQIQGVTNSNLLEICPDRLVQGSQEWHEFRRHHIGASDAAIIMGVSPYSTPYQLWSRKLGLLPEQEETGAMRRGKELEPIALAQFEKEMGQFMAPTVRVSRTVPWMMASLDGLSLDGKIAVEIKCPNRDTHQEAKEGRVPEKYIYQLQHQMLVLNVDLMYYFSFDGQKGVILEVLKDIALQEKLLSAEEKFWSSILNFELPELNERDYIQKTDADWAAMADRWKQIRNCIKKLEQDEEDCRNALIHMANQQNAQGCGVRVQTMPRKGLVDYSKIPELSGVDLNKYRKPATKIIRLSEVR